MAEAFAARGAAVEPGEECEERSVRVGEMYVEARVAACLLRDRLHRVLWEVAEARTRRRAAVEPGDEARKRAPHARRGAEPVLLREGSPLDTVGNRAD